MPQELHSVETWLAIGAYVLVWLLVSVWVRRLLKGSLAEIAERRKTAAIEVVAGSLPRPPYIAVFLAGMAIGVRWLPVSDKAKETLRHDVPIGLGVIGIAVAMRILFRTIDAYGRSNPELKSAAGMARASVWLLGLAAIALLLSAELGFSIAPALTAFGVGSLAVALALQDTLSNFFAGMYILIEKPIRPGDFVLLDASHEGYV